MIDYETSSSSLHVLADARGDRTYRGVSSGPGEARTILLLHIISVRPSKQPLMVRTFLKVYMELGSSFLFLQEQIKDIIIIGFNLALKTAKRLGNDSTLQ
jgi:hypothetical protein